MVIRGIIKYLLILVGIVVALGIITIGAMYFFPSVNLFGYQFYHGSIVVSHKIAIDESNEAGASHIIKVNGDIAGDFDVLILKSNGFDITVSTFQGTSYAEYFNYDFYTNMNGFKKVEDSNPQVVVTTSKRELISGEGEKKVLQIEVQEPSGLFIRQNTRLKLQIKDSLVNFERLIVESNSGNVTFSSAETTFNVDRADIKCLNGKVNLSNIKLNKTLNVEKNFGTFKMNEDITADVNINCNEGNIYFKDIKKANPADVKEVKVIGENGLISFGNIEGNADVRMHYGLFKAGTIKGEFNALSNPETGDRNSCDYDIGKVLQTVLIDNDSGKVSIGQTSEVNKNDSFSQIEINSKSGDIVIDNCFSKVVKITNGRGKITLGDCLGSLDLSTTYGAVNVSFLIKGTTIDGVATDDINNAVDALSTKILKIETGRENSGDGSINVSNIASKSTIIANGAGYINAKFTVIIGDNTVQSKRGRVEVITPTQTDYLLKWLARSADVQVYNIVTNKDDSFKYAQEKGIELNDGFIKVDGTTGTSEHKLNITASNSSLKVLEITRVMEE